MPQNLSGLLNEIRMRTSSRKFVVGLSLLPYLPELAKTDLGFKIHVPECFDEELMRSGSDRYGAPHLIQSVLGLRKALPSKPKNLNFEKYRDAYAAARSAGRIVVEKFVDIDLAVSAKTEAVFLRAYSKVKGCTKALAEFIACFYRQAFAWAHHSGTGVIEAGDKLGERFFCVEKLRNLVTTLIFPEDYLPPDGGLKILLNQQLPPRLRGVKFLFCSILAYQFEADVASLVFLAIDP